jgi:hypothetical protein
MGLQGVHCVQFDTFNPCHEPTEQSELWSMAYQTRQ